MPPKAGTKKQAANGKVFQLKVTLHDIKPPIWRRVLVDGSETLDEVPACLAGKPACPPEDCGGTWGYEELLVAIADPSHERHAALVDWIGGDFDPEAFDPTEFDDNLHLGDLASFFDD